MTVEQSGSVAEPSGTQTAILESQMDGGQDTSIEGKGASFDDFEDMESARTEFVKARTKSKGKDSDGEEVAEEKTSKVKKEVTREIKDADKKPNDDVEPRLGIDPAKAKVKLIKGNVGGEHVDINPETVLHIPVDGTKVDVPIQELIDQYNGKVAYDKRFNQLDLERKSFKEKERSFQEQSRVFRTFTELAQQDPSKAILYALDTAGVEPHTFFEKLQGSWMAGMEDAAGLTEEQKYALRIHQTQKENEFLKERTRTQLERTKEQQALRALESKIDQVRQSKGVSESEFEGAYQELVKLGHAKPTIEQVAETALDIKAIGKTSDILKAISPRLTDNKQIFEETWKHVREGSFSDEEIAHLVRESLGMKARAAVQRSAPIKTLKSKDPSALSESDLENGFFSDYDN